MADFPKLKVTHWIDGQASETILEFQQAPTFLFSYDVLVIVDGTVVRSFEKLKELASRAENRSKNFLEVRMETIIGGG